MAGAAAPDDEGASCVVGIDLGTTNSAVAVIEGDDIVVVPHEDRRFTIPSVVAFTAEGGVLVGGRAKRQAGANPHNTFYSVKRFIGQQYEAVQEEAGSVTFGVTADEEGAAVLVCDESESGERGGLG